MAATPAGDLFEWNTSVFAEGIQNFLETRRNFLSEIKAILDGDSQGHLDPPFPHLLQTNQIPSVEQRVAITQFLHEIKSQASTLSLDLGVQKFLHDETILEAAARLQTILEECISSGRRILPGSPIEASIISLQDVIISTQKHFPKLVQYTALEMSVLRHKAVLSHLRAFPPELLAEIFTFAVLPRPFHEELTSVPIEDPPYFISHAVAQVCSYWREVALSTPQLWTDIPIIDEACTVNEYSDFIFLVDAFLERSKSLPINVYISLVHRDLATHTLDDPALEDVPPNPHALAPILNQSHRWKTAVMHIHLVFFDILPTVDLPLLEKLNVRCYNGKFLPAGLIAFPINFFDKTRALKVLIMDGTHDLAEGIDVLCSGLESYTGLPDRLSALSAAQPSLIDCSFRGPLSRMSLAGPPLKFPNLKTLRVANTNYQHPLNFSHAQETPFRYIEAPSLESLLIQGHPKIDEGAIIIPELISVTLAQNSCLRSLTLHILVPSWIIHPLFEHTPCLEELDMWDISTPNWQENVFKIQPGDGKPFLPNLKSLIIHNSAPTNFKCLESLYHSRRERPGIVRGLKIELVYSSAPGCRDARDIANGWGDVDSLLGNYEKGPEHSKLLRWSSYLVKNFLAHYPDMAEKFGVSRQSGLCRQLFN